MLVYQVEVDGYHGKVALESILSQKGNVDLSSMLIVG